MRKDFRNARETLELKEKELNAITDFLKAAVDGMVVGQVSQPPDNIISNSDLHDVATGLLNSVSNYVNDCNDLKQKLIDSQDQVSSILFGKSFASCIIKIYIN